MSKVRRLAAEHGQRPRLVNPTRSLTEPAIAAFEDRGRLADIPDRLEVATAAVRG